MTSFTTPNESHSAKGFFTQDITNLKLLILATIGGTLIGTAVAGVRVSVGYIQVLLFGVDVNLLNSLSISPFRILSVTLCGGLLLGSLLVLAGRYNHLAIVDPVEANALEGGRMSLRDSLILVGLSTVSIAIGGSVGFEAAMTQLGAGILSFVGQQLNLSRRELRVLVSCGTGAGIAAIFGAPLAGAFYALELVVGGYAMRALMPTLLASTMSSLAIYVLIGYQPIFPANIVDAPTFWHFPLAILIGFVSAIIGVTVMRGTTGFEYLLKKAKVNALFKPVIGALCLGAIAVFIPQVMGPGHNGINEILAGREWLGATGLILIAKILASIVCVGSGFRGGLFSSSLFLGAALGCIIHGVVLTPFFQEAVPLDLAVVAGMGGIAASIIGTPIAIILLMIETAGIHSGVITTVITVVIASQLTRHWFGYSFSTWRFHIRGSDIAGPRDIGRLRALKFSDLRLKKPLSLPIHTPLSNAAKEALKAGDEIIAVDDSQGRFVGLVTVKDLSAEVTRVPPFLLCNLVKKPFCVQGSASIANYIDTTEDEKEKELAVLDDQGHLEGIASEVVVLRRYLNEVIAADGDEVGTITTN